MKLHQKKTHKTEEGHLHGVPLGPIGGQIRLSGVQIIYLQCLNVAMVALAKFAIACRK